MSEREASLVQVCFSRSIVSQSANPWDKWLHPKWNMIKDDLKAFNIDIVGENMYGIHSIEYSGLDEHFYVFAVKNTKHDVFLSWDEIEYYAELFDFPTVPKIQRILTITPPECGIVQLKNYFKLRRLMKAFNPEIIICDFEPIGLYLRKNIPHVLVFNFDPLMYKEFAKKGLKKHYFQHKYISWVYNRAKKINAKIIIPTLEKHDSSEYNFVNPIVRPLPTESQKDLLKKLNLKSPPIIIMFGGSHFATNLLYKIQNVLHKVDDEFIVFAYKLFGESYDNIKFLSFKDNFLDYLKASKGIISQAGFQTLSESILLKKPSLIFPIPNFLEQELIASWAEKEGVSMKESKKYLSEKDLLRIIKTFIDSLPEMQKNLNKIHLQPTGAKEAAEIISNLVKQEK